MCVCCGVVACFLLVSFLERAYVRIPCYYVDAYQNEVDCTQVFFCVAILLYVIVKLVLLLY